VQTVNLGEPFSNATEFIGAIDFDECSGEAAFAMPSKVSLEAAVSQPGWLIARACR